MLGWPDDTWVTVFSSVTFPKIKCTTQGSLQQHLKKVAAEAKLSVTGAPGKTVNGYG